jgi:hypothetical protein
MCKNEEVLNGQWEVIIKHLPKHLIDEEIKDLLDMCRVIKI